MVNYIPWRLIRSWKCLACGRCCKKYRVNLTWEEYEKIARYWPQEVKRTGDGFYLKRRPDGGCRFLWGKLCYLQILNMKPLACKLWPFMILTRPDKMDINFEGLYQFKNKEYFVYLNPKCSGINKGDPLNLKKVIEEVINLWLGLKKNQYYSTNRESLLSTLVVSQEYKEYKIENRFSFKKK